MAPSPPPSTSLPTRRRHTRHFLSCLREILHRGGRAREDGRRWWPEEQEQDEGGRASSPLLDLPVTCAEGRRVVASRLLLAAASPGMATILQESDPASTVLHLPDLPADDLLEFLDTLLIFDNCEESRMGAVTRVCQHLGMGSPVVEEEEEEKGKEAEERWESSEGEEANAAGYDADDVEEEDACDGAGASANDRWGPLVCPLCRRRYQHAKARNRHLLSEHGRECVGRGWYFRCPRCPMAFVSASGRERHLQRTHQREQRRKAWGGEGMEEDEEEERAESVSGFPCPFCSSSSPLRVSGLKELREHVRRCHQDRDRCCVVCGKECGTRDDVHQHLQTHGSDTPEGRLLFSCERCQHKFLSEYALVSHRRDAHSLNERFECRYCGKYFRNAKYCSNHEGRHKSGELDDESSLRCDTCARTFSNRHNLLRHVRDAHPGEGGGGAGGAREDEVAVAARGASSSAAAKRRKGGRFRCQECGKDFVDSTRLRQHRWIHTGYHPYKCDECERGFRHLSHLRRHRARDHGRAEEERRFPCRRCGRAFFYAYQLRKHEKVAHRGEAADKEDRLLCDMQGKGEEGEEEEDDWVQTVFQCALCQDVFDSYEGLHAHCSERHSAAADVATPQSASPHHHHQHFVADDDCHLPASLAAGGGRQIVLEVPPGTEAATAAAIAAAAGGQVGAAEGVRVDHDGGEEGAAVGGGQFVILYDQGNLILEK